MSRSTKIPPHLTDFAEQVMAEARANGYPGRPRLRSRLAASAALLALLVGSMALGDVTVAQALTSISQSV